MKISIRLLGRLTIAFSVSAHVSSVKAELPSPEPGKPPIPVIDIHTHAFNIRDLPIKGILGAKGAPPGVDAALAKALINRTAEDDWNTPFPSLLKESTDTVKSALRKISEDTAPSDLGEPGSLFSELTEEQKNALLEFVGETTDPEILRSVLAKDRTIEGTEISIIALALMQLGFPPGESDTDESPLLQAALEGEDREEIVRAANGYIDSVKLLTTGNVAIARQLEQEEYPKTDLFIHHMMDMAKAYNDEPSRSFAEQMTGMAKLNERFGGKFLHFVAFDPFRGTDSLKSIRNGITAGAIGVKVYPPSGYRATENEIPPKPGLLKIRARKRWNSRYENLSNLELNELNMALFAHCAEEDIPIFTHCTPKGFEAEKKYGLMANPKYWEAVLELYPDLHLCFAHSGGEGYWFSGETTNETPQVEFGAKVVDLCLKYPNVFCEVGYLDEILNAESRVEFKRKLLETIERKHPDKTWKFGQKFMYGTDWHMVHKESNHREMTKAFYEVFSDPALVHWMRPFFSGNAIRFINLDEVAKAPKFSSEQREYWEELMTKALVAP